jgi:hypothetical protein
VKNGKQFRKQATGAQDTQTASRSLQKKTAITVVKVFLLIFLVGSLAGIAGEEFHWGHGNSQVADSHLPEIAGEPATDKTVTAKPPADESAAKEQRTVIAYYFRGSTRCYSCETIENYAHGAIEAGFSDALKDRRLQWKVVNVEEPGNEHFIKDYQLYSQSVVLVELCDGKQTKWKNLEQVWLLLGDKSAFTRYVQEEVRLFLAESR